MHVCMVTPEFPPTVGGIGFYVLNLSKTLVKKGHQVTVITRGYWRSGCQQTEGMKIIRTLYLPTYPFHLQLHGIFVQKMLKSIEKTLDVVHVHLPCVHPFRTSVPIMVTVHTLARVSMTAGPVYYSLKSAVNSDFVFPTEHRMLRKANLVTSVSYTVAEELRELHGCKAEVVGNGVDTEFFTPKKLSKDSGYVTFSGRLTTEKGVLDLIEAAKYVLQQEPTTMFVLAGSGPLEEVMKKSIQKKGLQGNFVLLGDVGRTEILRLYQLSSMLVLPSFYESFPNTILEAMACGLPVVATNVCDIPRIVEDGENGFLVPPRDPHALSQRITELLEDQSLRRRMGESCRKRAENLYSLNSLTERILGCYDSLEEYTSG